MSNTEGYAAVVQVLVAFWGGEKPSDPSTLNTCWNLADKLLQSLPSDASKRIQRSPHAHINTIASELVRLVQRDVIARSLADALAKTTQVQQNDAQQTMGSFVEGARSRVVHVPQGSTIAVKFQNDILVAPGATSTLDLELVFATASSDVWLVTVILRDAEGRADEVLIPTPGAQIHIDSNVLRAASSVDDYGAALGAMLFADDRLRYSLHAARQRAAGINGVVRLRLQALPTDLSFHHVRWEQLAFPIVPNTSPEFLATTADILLVRYLPSSRPLTSILPARQHVRALVAVAAPRNLKVYGLTPIDSDAEIQQVWAALSNCVRQSLPATTAPRLARALEAGADVLYLVCHGSVHEGETYLWLEDEHGHAKRLAGADFITMLADLPAPPQLIVLTACYGTGQGDGKNNGLIGLGPRLAASGVSAVLVMSEQVYAQTLEMGIPILFEALPLLCHLGEQVVYCGLW